MRVRPALVGLAWAGLAGCAGAGDEALRASTAPSPAARGVALERPEFGESADGQPVWTARAARARYRTDAKIADLEAVEAGFYEGGKLVTRGRAPGAVWREANRELALIGGATLESATRRAGVEARAARWDAAAGRLHADGGVRFWQGSNNLSAKALKADRALRRVELTGGVVGRFALGPGTSWAPVRSGRKAP